MTTQQFYLKSKKRYLKDAEQSRIMTRLLSLRPHMSLDHTWDDIGTATLMKDVYEETLRYCPQEGDWYIYDGARWERQGEYGIVSDMLQTLLNLLRLYCHELEVDKTEDPEVIEGYLRYVNSLRKHTAMRNIIEVLKTMLRLSKRDMDTDPYILNTPRVAYDLRTGKTLTETREKVITMKTQTSMPTAYQSRCDRWYSFILEIMDDNAERAAFLQRALGYSLLGVNREECMFVMYGRHTRNGKGTLTDAIRAALGEEYANSAPTDLICEGRNGRPTDFNAPQPTLSRLVGTRLVFMSESGKNVRLDAANMKALTGRDTLVTRGLYEASFSFLPQFTLWLQTNHLPAVTDDTVFMSDRIWVIEFNRKFDESQRDRNLKELFSDPENRPTILEWLMDGCRDYIQNGLNPPDCVREATENYRKMHDRIGNFLDEETVLAEGKAIMRGDLYAEYRAWCRKGERNYNPIGSTSFYSEITTRGYPLIRRSDGWYFVDMDFKALPPADCSGSEHLYLGVVV